MSATQTQTLKLNAFTSADFELLQKNATLNSKIIDRPQTTSSTTSAPIVAQNVPTAHSQDIATPSHTPLIKGVAHINLLVPQETLPAARVFYAQTLGFTPSPVPAAQKRWLAWFNVGTTDPSADKNYQQVHISCLNPLTDEALKHQASSGRHPCFKLDRLEDLMEIKKRIYEHFQRGGLGAPMHADPPEVDNSGLKDVEFPTRFFARDYAGNRLEFSL